MKNGVIKMDEENKARLPVQYKKINNEKTPIENNVYLCTFTGGIRNVVFLQHK